MLPLRAIPAPEELISDLTDLTAVPPPPLSCWDSERSPNVKGEILMLIK